MPDLTPQGYAAAIRAEMDEREAEEVERLAAAWHAAWEWQHDECDHGTYRGGPNNGQPYAMCEIMAKHVAAHDPQRVLARLADDRQRVERDLRVLERHHIDLDAVWQDCAVCGHDWPCPDGEVALASLRGLYEALGLTDVRQP